MNLNPSSRTSRALWLLVLLLWMLPAMVRAQFTFITNNGAITITGYTATDAMVNIPDTTNNLSVVSIGDNAFFNDTNLMGVSIPASVTNIGSYSFHDTGLTNVSVSRYVTGIGEGAFVYCPNLKAITVDLLNPAFSSPAGVLFDKNQTVLFQCPGARTGGYFISNTVARIGPFAFASCPGLVSVAIPNSVTSIDEAAFFLCALTDIVIPASVTNIDDHAFAANASLAHISIPNSVTAIGDFAFARDYALTNISISTSLISIANSEFNDCTNLVSFDIPDGVTDIGTNAFLGCSSLTNVVIPNSVIIIRDKAFGLCPKLVNAPLGTNVASIGSLAFGDTHLPVILIPASVTNIGVQAFAFCTNMYAIDVPVKNAFYSSVQGVLFDKNQTMLLQCPAGKIGGYTIPDGVTDIVDMAFENCAGLTEVAIPDSVTDIGTNAFINCTSLTTATVGNGVTLIGADAFAGCPALTGIYCAGSAPLADGSIIIGDTNAVLYYLTDSNGWFELSLTYANFLPIAPWLPQVQTGGSDFGVRTNRFGFDINWAAGQTVVVLAATNLANPVWVPVSTNLLATGTGYFSDAQWKNYSRRYYRVSLP